jgi:hypothetical protein
MVEKKSPTACQGSGRNLTQPFRQYAMAKFASCWEIDFAGPALPKFVIHRGSLRHELLEAKGTTL